MRFSTIFALAMAATGAQANNLRNPTAAAAEESRELQAGTTETGGRNVDVDGNCINVPQQGGVNAQVFATITNPDRSNTGYPAFNTETCIFEPSQCVDFKTIYDNALILVDDAVNSQPDLVGTPEYLQAEEIVTLGSDPDNFACWTSGPEGNCNAPGACCRRLNSAFICDREHDGGIESFSTMPCICNDFTILPGSIGGGGGGVGGGGGTGGGGIGGGI